MTRIVIRELIWEEWTIIHIQKHALIREEVERAVENFVYHKQTYNKRYLIVGRSGERIISVIIRPEGRSKYRVITARDSDRKERRRLYEKEKGK